MAHFRKVCAITAYLFSNVLFACDPRYMDCSDAEPGDSGIGVGEGLIAVIAFIALIYAYKGLSVLFHGSEGWRKAIPPLVVGGIFAVNAASKFYHTDRSTHIFLLTAYILGALFVCVRLHVHNTKFSRRI